MSLGGGTSKSDSEQRIDPNQLPFLQDLWRQAQTLNQQNQPGSAVDATKQALAGAAPALGAGLGGFMGAAAGQLPGQQTLQQAMSQTNPWLESAISGVGQDIGQNLAENILPTLRSGGVAAGQFGGSRGQIAQGLAAQGAQEEFSQVANQMRMQDISRQQAAAGMLTQSQLAGAAGAMQGAPMAFQFGMSPYNAQWAPLNQYARLISPPVVTGQSDSSGFNFGFSF